MSLAELHRRRRRLGTVIAVGMVPAFFLIGCSKEEPPTEPQNAVEVMEAPQEEADRLPELKDGTEGIRLETVRSLGSSGEANFWVTLNDDENVCLLVTFREDEYTLSSSCGELDIFLRDGLAMKTIMPANKDGEEQRRAEVYLLPDDVNAEPLDDYLADHRVPVESPEGLSEERSALQKDVNIFSLGAGAYELQPLELDRTFGEPFTFRPLG